MLQASTPYYLMYTSTLNVQTAVILLFSLCAIDMQVPRDNVSALAFTVNGRIMAMGTAEGDLSFFEKCMSLLKFINSVFLSCFSNISLFNYIFLAKASHPVETIELQSLTIPGKGGENVCLGDGVSLEVPERFIDDECLSLKYAVIPAELFGPFVLPSGCQLISEILALHPEKDVDLRIPIEITMPHSLYTDAAASVGINFCKAKVTDVITQNGKKYIKFSKMPSKELSLFCKKKKR